MNVDINSEEKQVICRFSKRLDTIVAYDMEPHIDQATELGKKLIFDFYGVDYISSTFLRICIKKYKELGNEQFWIRHAKPEIKKVFKIAGLEKMIRE